MHIAFCVCYMHSTHQRVQCSSLGCARTLKLFDRFLKRVIFIAHSVI
jgi:hypothetical protein